MVDHVATGVGLGGLTTGEACSEQGSISTRICTESSSSLYPERTWRMQEVQVREGIVEE